MSNDAIVDFAQRRFGTDAGFPTEACVRTPVPHLLLLSEWANISVSMDLFLLSL